MIFPLRCRLSWKQRQAVAHWVISREWDALQTAALAGESPGLDPGRSGHSTCARPEAASFQFSRRFS